MPPSRSDMSLLLTSCYSKLISWYHVTERYLGTVGEHLLSEQQEMSQLYLPGNEKLFSKFALPFTLQQCMSAPIVLILANTYNWLPFKLLPILRMWNDISGLIWSFIMIKEVDNLFICLWVMCASFSEMPMHFTQEGLVFFFLYF